MDVVLSTRLKHCSMVSEIEQARLFVWNGKTQCLCSAKGTNMLKISEDPTRICYKITFKAVEQNIIKLVVSQPSSCFLNCVLVFSTVVLKQSSAHTKFIAADFTFCSYFSQLCHLISSGGLWNWAVRTAKKFAFSFAILKLPICIRRRGILHCSAHYSLQYCVADGVHATRYVRVVAPCAACSWTSSNLKKLAFIFLPKSSTSSFFRKTGPYLFTNRARPSAHGSLVSHLLQCTVLVRALYSWKCAPCKARARRGSLCSV